MGRKNFKSTLNVLFQIRRMQQMLKQMQEKLKVDAQDISKKHDSIINV